MDILHDLLCLMYMLVYHSTFSMMVYFHIAKWYALVSITTTVAKLDHAKILMAGQFWGIYIVYE